jgi:FMN reductase
MRLIVVVGNPKPQSRTRAVAELVAKRVAELTGACHDLTVDLCDYADDLFRSPHEELATLTARVAAAGILIVATPTYKASYTGMLKAFLDRYPSGGLTGVTAIPIMTIADPVHTLAVDFTLRPLLVELGASVPTRGLAFLTAEIDQAEQVVDRWLSANESVLRRIAR